MNWRTPIYPSHLHVGKGWWITSYGLAASHRTVILKCLLQGAQFGTIKKHRMIGQPDLKPKIKSALGDYLCWHNRTLTTL